MAGDSVRLPIEYDGADELLAKLDAIEKGIQGTARAAEGADQSLRKAIAANVLADALGRVSQAFDGSTKAALQSAEQIAKGFLAGGPVGGAIAGISTLVSLGADEWKKWGEAEKRVLLQAAADADAVVAAIQKSNEAIAGTFKARQEALSLVDAQNLAAQKGVALDEAKLILQQRSLATQIAAKQAELDAARASPDLDATGKVERTERELAALRDAERTSQAQEIAIANQAAIDKRAKDRDAHTQQLIALGNYYEERIKFTRDREARLNEIAEAARDDEIAGDEERAKKAEELAQKEQDAFKRDRRERTAIAEQAAAAQRGIEEREAAAKNQAYEAEQQRIADLEKSAKQQAATAAISLGAMALDFITSEERKTKAMYEQEAKRAAIQAAVMTATALADFALGNEAGAVAAGIAAAQYALIAAGEGIASATAPTSAPASSGGASGSGGTVLAGGSSGNSGSGRGGGTTINVVMGSGGLLVTSDDVQRAAAAAVSEAERKR